MAAVDVARAKQIASLQDHEGRCVLAVVLGLGPYEDEVNMQNAIKVDFLYDHLMFAVNKGFTWEQVCCVFQFAQDFLEDCKEKNITQMVKTYQAQSADLFTSLGERNYKLYTDFLFSTFFTHFQLYKFVVNNSREQNVPEINVDIHPPIPPPVMGEGTELSVWNYQRTWQEVEERETSLEKQHEAKKQQTEADNKQKHAEGKAKVESARTPFSKETLQEMIRSVLQEYSSSTAKTLTTEIENVREDLEIKLQKTAIPRPKALGPPPRFAQKPAVQPLPKPSTVNQGRATVKAEKPRSSRSRSKSSPNSGGSSRASKRM